MAKHKWNFKSRFRRAAYGWKGTALAAKRMKEAVSEIKKVAKNDLSLAGEGVVELFCRLYPAVMQIDGSSGAIGTALHRTVDQLTPILIQADWDMNSRGKWLQKLYEAIQEDGWGVFDSLRDRWGDLCVYSGLAHLWADELISTVRDIWSSPEFSIFPGTDMCLSCLLYTERYAELYALIQLDRTQFWHHIKFWPMALIKQGNPQEALDYVAQIRSQQGVNNEEPEMDAFCEATLIKMGHIEEAYQQYGLKLPSYGTYLNIYRSLCKRYPSLDKRRILIDCMDKTGSKGKWFAAAKNAGFLDIALSCAKSRDGDPNTLLRATRDYAEKDAEFAVSVGIEAIMIFLTADFYDPITSMDIKQAYNQVAKVAEKAAIDSQFSAGLSRRVLKESNKIKPALKNVIMNRFRT
ncbi:hypothetical protein ACFL6U_12940 [Planctomycetota bacterium]